MESISPSISYHVGNLSIIFSSFASSCYYFPFIVLSELLFLTVKRRMMPSVDEKGN